METTKNELDPYSKHFFMKLGNYLDTQIYYFGSIQRDDFFPGKSDIDVDIFTYNIQSTITQLQNFLDVERSKFKKFVYKLHKTKKMVHGYKVKYEDEANHFVTEISIYQEKDKAEVLIEHNAKSILPFYVCWMLIILKCFYYRLGLLPDTVYRWCKRLLMNYMVEGEDVEFITTDVTFDTA